MTSISSTKGLSMLHIGKVLLKIRLSILLHFKK